MPFLLWFDGSGVTSIFCVLFIFLRHDLVETLLAKPSWIHAIA
jgi:hypothetical protein